MGPGASDANWYIPEDTSAAIELFYKAENHAKLGQGGNPTKAALNECAAYLVKNLKIKGIFEATLVLEIWSSVNTGAEFISLHRAKGNATRDRIDNSLRGIAPRTWLFRFRVNGIRNNGKWKGMCDMCLVYDTQGYFSNPDLRLLYVPEGHLFTENTAVNYVIKQGMKIKSTIIVSVSSTTNLPDTMVIPRHMEDVVEIYCPTEEEQESAIVADMDSSWKCLTIVGLD
ncbi:hypothetical protein F5890DRAFT_1589072 [Lentinula detonsa]|uniref:Uncharacterized protein n=1 Tax=Lentinula detonsa TaxID=2804962 RepID=A0AA38UNV4_9AGAR|nr:hypothetical protein F5890DRAFT_1589072 [Lentinula detonsa]